MSEQEEVTLEQHKKRVSDWHSVFSYERALPGDWQLIEKLIAELAKHEALLRDVIKRSNQSAAISSNRMSRIKELEAELAKHEALRRSGWNLAELVQALYDDGFLQAAVYTGVVSGAKVYLDYYRKLELGEQE